MADVDAVRRLSPLPETADELRAIAKVLNAGEGSVFVGNQATERAVRNAYLADSWVLAFATHALVAGEIRGQAASRGVRFTCANARQAACEDQLSSFPTETTFAGGFSINRNMVYTGWALAYRRYSTDYIDTEEGAKSAKRGLWRGKFVAPWVRRKQKRGQQ